MNKEEKSQIELLLDENNTDNLKLYDENNKETEFEQVAFTLAKDSISKPFATQYGIHIVKKLDSRSIPPFDECRKNILRMMKRDERAIMPQQERIKQLKAELGYKENPKFVELVTAEIEQYGK